MRKYTSVTSAAILHPPAGVSSASLPSSPNGPLVLTAGVPDVRLVPSGGVSTGNAHAFLDHGAFAVCCGTEVVPPIAVAAGDHEEIAHRAARFVRAALNEPAAA